MYNLIFGFQHEMSDLRQECAGKYLRPWKDSFDIYCSQEVRWKWQGTKIIGHDFKFLWSECYQAENSVGVIVTNWLIGKVVGVER